MQRLRFALSVLVLLALVSACCFAGPPPPPGPAVAPPPPPPTPTPGHTCHILADVGFAPTKPDGSPWDVGGGAPDPFLIVRQNGVEIGRSTRVQDSRFAHWELDVACDHAVAVDIEVLDGDLSLDDSAYDYRVPADVPFASSVLGETVEGTIVISRT